MERTSRRNLLRAVAAGGAAAAGIGVALRTGISSDAAAQGNGHSHGLSDAPSGPQASATVNFGHWRIDPPFDRMTQPPLPERNVHFITPNEVKIKAGGVSASSSRVCTTCRCLRTACSRATSISA